MTDINEAEALREVRALSLNARRYLGHTLRNPLQIISGAAETGDADMAKDGVLDMRHALERLGL